MPEKVKGKQSPGLDAIITQIPKFKPKREIRNKWPKGQRSLT